jgi:hypothetical protein
MLGLSCAIVKRSPIGERGLLADWMSEFCLLTEVPQHRSNTAFIEP